MLALCFLLLGYLAKLIWQMSGHAAHPLHLLTSDSFAGVFYQGSPTPGLNYCPDRSHYLKCDGDMKEMTGVQEEGTKRETV